MRILIVHNYYGSSAPSGENKVFEAEKAMLEKHGHEVIVYTRHSDEIRGTCNEEQGTLQKLWGMVKGALCTIGNPFAARAVAKKCSEFKPDVVHFHNTFPLISPLAVRAASKYAPVVMTLHNYRTVCAAGVPTRNGKICSLCIDKRCSWDGVKNRCYRGSLLATVPLSINITLYSRWLPRWVRRFLVFSEFQCNKMLEYGFPKDAMALKSNSIRLDRVCHNGITKEDQIVYVGRLSQEKGVHTLIKAWRMLGDSIGCRLVLIGDGDYRADYEALAKGLGVEFMGKQANDTVRSEIAKSKALVLPSECWEGMPMTILESFAGGTPCVVSNLGALPEYMRNGALGEVFEAGDSEACAEAIKRLLSRQDYDKMCAAAKHEAEERYSEDANYKRLMEIYGDVVAGVDSGV